MPGKHRFRNAAAAATLAMGLGWFFWLGEPVSAAEFPALGVLPFHLTSPASGHHGSELLVQTWSFGQQPSPKLKGGWPKFEESAALNTGDLSEVAFSYANMWSQSDHFRRHGQSHMHKHKDDISPVPLPSSVWLFLAALALLFGMSRRYNSENG